MSTAQEMMDLLGKQEELDPELADYLEDVGQFGPCIRHPLVYSMVHFPQQNAWVNNQLRAKKAAIVRARDAKEWHSFIYLHERPYRVEAFVSIMDRMTDEQYWQNLASIWMDSENIRQNPKVWQHLMSSKRGSRESIMDDEEVEALEAMPASIVVYQGHTKGRHDGWSWTTDKAKAEWFAQRFSDFEHSPPMLTEGVVLKRSVIAYFAGRGESEIVAPRQAVKQRKVTELRKRS
jgi:hypothetical protein